MAVGLRIVVVAVGEDVGDRRTDAVARRLDQAQQNVLGRELDAEVILRQAAIGGHHLDRACVRELVQLSVRPRNADVAEAGGVADCVDGRLLPGEVVPSVGRLGPSIALQVEGLLPGGDLRRLAGVDADEDDVEVLARSEMHHHQSAGNAVHLLRAEHGAVVIDQRQNRGALAEVVAQAHGLARVVDELRVQRKHLVQALRDADLLQYLRQLIAGVLTRLLVSVAGYLAARGGSQQRTAEGRADPDLLYCPPNCSTAPHLLPSLFRIRSLASVRTSFTSAA